MRNKLRIAVVSPFLDKQHGTERGVCEWVSHLADEFDICIYSQRVDDIDLSKVRWRKIVRLPGSHLINYLWWFVANHLWRAYDKIVRGLTYDILFSPGINCLDADVVSVHVVFADVYEQKRRALDLRHCDPRSWLRVIHRRLYYRLIIALERRIYIRSERVILPVSRKTAGDIERYYGLCYDRILTYPGVDSSGFDRVKRDQTRKRARSELKLADDSFVLLLVGNDWYCKGLPILAQSLHLVKSLPISLLVVGNDQPRQFQTMLREYGVEGKVRFLPPRADIIFYYSAADVYTGPSLADAFAQPIAEAMACGLPVIASAKTGASELITDGVDGLILKDPTDATELARLIKHLYIDSDARQRMGEAAAIMVCHRTWEQSASQLGGILRWVTEWRRTRAGAFIEGLP